MTRRPLRALPALMLLTLACGTAAPVERARELPVRIPTVAPDVGEPCLDVGDRRVCWTASGEASLVMRTLPPTEAVSPLGFRCTGQRDDRACRDRALDASTFECAGERCVQRHVRLPDDGQWECIETAGALVCRGGGSPAGVHVGPADEGFVCGARAGRDERICVDLDPDRPPRPATCRVEHEGGMETRVCAVGPSAATTELPARPTPSCWLDTDCDGGRACAAGTCR